MKSRYEAYMDGAALSDIHSDLYVADIQYPQVSLNNTENVLAMRQGALISNAYLKEITVTIVFSLFVYNTQERNEALREVCRWANGKVLETSDREDQRLMVRCKSYPAMNALKWTDQLQMTFSATLLPYWESKNAVTATVSANGSKTLYVPGNIPADEYRPQVDVEATLTGSATSVSISTGTDTITLSGLNFAANDVIRVYHDENLFLHITLNGTSILDKRTGSNDLRAACGRNTVSITGPMNAAFTVRGVWR